jgi:VanZ family protein
MPDSSNHAAKPFRRTGRFVAVLAWSGLIFAASHRPNLRVSDDDLVDLVVRKFAHLFVYGVLAILVLRLLQPDDDAVPTAPVLVTAWLLTVAYAISDEWHQTFIDGRSGQASDVAIDAAGAAIALAAIRRLRRLTANRRRNPQR